uniref:hypothetical protein n=1 Tax=Alloprevotella sp. TaxID=1872471 RepID=UPI003FEDD42D
MNNKIIYTIAAAAAGAIEEGVRNLLRNKGQKKLQEAVNNSSPKPTKVDLTVPNNHVQLTILDDNNIDLVRCQESSMSDKEIQEWKSLLSTLGGGTTKTALTASTFNGLVKCDVPLKDLCRVNGNPDAMRGMVIKNGKISKQASFSETELGNMAPLMVFQCMAAVTSQYYQQVIFERLNAIDNKLNHIIEFLAADDRTKLIVSYNRFVELSQKNTYDIADKQIISEFSNYVEIIREKYRHLLASINNLNVDYECSDKKEAELKIQALKDSKYFDYLDIAMQAEVLTFIASAISMKVAGYLGNEEDITNYANRMSLDYWNNYVDQFNRIKHDVIKYLELEAKASWKQRKL